MPNWKKVIVSGSDAALNSLTVTAGVTGSLQGTASWAANATTATQATTLNIVNTPSTAGTYYPLFVSSTSGYLTGRIDTSTYTYDTTTNTLTVTSSFATTASYVNTLNQSVVITSSAAIGTSSLGPFENTLTLGARDNTSEGGQIGFNAPGGTYTSASMLDNWQNQFRILRGTNAGSDALVANWSMHTKQMSLPAYNSVSAFVGTAVANLAVDSSGNIITVSTSGGSVFPYNGNAVITGSLTTTGIIYAQPNGGMYFQGGDDAALYDINVANTMGVYGVQDSTIGSIKLGSGGGTISGKSSNIGINTTNPTSASLTIGGNVWATSLTGSLLGTASTASYYNGTIPNTQLANSSITVGTTAISLGASSTSVLGLSAVQVTGSLKVASAGLTKIIDTALGNLYDVYGNTSVNFGSNQLYNYYGANVVNWGSNFLLSSNNTSAGTMSIDWENRYLADTAATQRLKWTTSGVQVTGSLRSTGGFTGSLQGTASWASNATTALTASSVTPLNQTVKITGSLVVSGSVDTVGGFMVSDTVGVPSADLGAARILRDTAGGITLNYGSQILYGAGSVPSLNWRFRYLIGDDGSTTTADWKQMRLYSSASAPASKSVDWDTRELWAVDSLGGSVAVANWSVEKLYDDLGVTSVSWNARRLHDAAGNMSVHYGARALVADDGATTFEWDATSAGQRYANQSYYYLRTQVDQNTQEEFTNVSANVFQPEGRILQGVTFSNVSNFDFVFLDSAAGEWQKVDNVTTRATKMLGIAFSVGQANCVLLEGHVQVNGGNTADCPYVVGIDHGLPIYVSASNAATITVPSGSGKYVRIIGHAYYNSINATDYWTMNFRPDHAWVEL